MAKIALSRSKVPAGGGPFALAETTIGIFLSDQPKHRLALGGDTRIFQPLKPNEGWILPAGSEGLCEFDADLDVLTLSLDAEMLREAGLDQPDRFGPVVGTLDPLLLSMAMSAEGFASGSTLYRETMQRAVAAQLAQVVAPAPPEAATIDDARLRRAVSYIHDNLAEDLSLEAMAGLAAMSTSRFSRAFKAATGRSPLQYVIEQRLQMAATLLRTTKLPVAEIAYRVGYNDLSRFGQHIKRRFGATPAKLREA